MPYSVPRLVMVGGPNGSGKSTLTTYLQGQGYAFGEYINADDIAGTLSGEEPGRSQLAQRIADTARTACLLARQSFSFETVMSHPSKFELLRTAREAGYDVTLFFVSTDDPAINLDRVRMRVAAGGHPVAHHLVETRYRRTMSHLYSAVRASDRSVVFDNSGSGRTQDAGDRALKPVAELSTDGNRVMVTRTSPSVPDWVGRHLLDLVEADRLLYEGRDAAL